MRKIFSKWLAKRGIYCFDDVANIISTVGHWTASTTIISGAIVMLILLIVKGVGA